MSGYYLTDSGAKLPSDLELDSRWLDASIQADLPVLVCNLARPNYPTVISYLVKLLELKPKGLGAATARSIGQSGLVIHALTRCQHAAVTDVFLKAVGDRMQGAQHIDFDLQRLLHSARYLPAADLPKLDAFAAKLDEKFVDQYLEALGPLREKNQPNQS
jgi:hypothetical protein